MTAIIIHHTHCLQQVMTPSALPLCRGSTVLGISHLLSLLPVLILFNTRPFWVYGPYLLFQPGWQKGLLPGITFRTLFFKGDILSDLFLRGIEKTLKSPSGRVRNYPSFLLFWVHGFLLAFITLRSHPASSYRLLIVMTVAGSITRAYLKALYSHWDYGLELLGTPSKLLVSGTPDEPASEP
jgi:hypothetical protein